MRGHAALSATLAAALSAATATAAADDGWARDESTGHRYRVAFDPASRISLGAAVAAARGPDGKPAVRASIDAGLAYRTVSVSGAGRDRVAWQVEHRVASGSVTPGAGPRAGVPALDAAAYGVSILRHDELPSLVLPSSPPVGIPFPFDVGLDAEVGRVAITALSPTIHVGVVRAAILLDPVRSRLPGRIFAVGLGVRYDLDASPSAPVVHRVAPMTEGSVRIRVESRDGLMLADLRGAVAPTWSSAGAWSVLARASAHAERTLLAVYDQPLAVVLDGGYRLDPGAPTSGTTRSLPTSDFRVSLGLALSLSLKR